MYLTYDEYQSYGGTLGEAEFVLAEVRARKRIDYITDSRAAGMSEVPEEVKLCMMLLIKADGVTGVDAQADSPLVASFNTDGYSESYGSAQDQIESLSSAARLAVRDMLYGVTDDYGVPLLYRGLCV